MEQTQSAEARLTRDGQMVREYIERAIVDYSTTVLSTQLLRQFALEFPDLFCDAGLVALLRAPDSPGQRYLSVLLSSQQSLLRNLSDPWRFSTNEAVLLFKNIARVDRSLDVRLARCLPNRHGIVREPGFDTSLFVRALDILDQASDGARVVPILAHLVDSPDPRISGKATLMVGKRVQNVNWVQRNLLKDDPRIRANAIESIWGLNTPQAKQLLWNHTHDMHNRVAGNSVFGLHVLGEERTPQLVIRMSNESKADFRWTAAWVMGMTAEPCYVDPLTQLLKDYNPVVRSASLRSLLKIRKEQAKGNETLAVTSDLSEEQVKQIEKVSNGLSKPPGRPAEKEEDLIVAPEFKIHLDGANFATQMLSKNSRRFRDHL